MRYPALFERDPKSGVIVVTFVDLPGGTQADSMEEAERMASDCLATTLSVFVDRGEDLPTPHKTKARGVRWVAPPALAETKLALYGAMRETGVGTAELARRLGWTVPRTEGLFDIRRASRLDEIDQAFRALGMRLKIGVEAAA